MASLAPRRIQHVCAAAPIAATGFPVDADTYQRFESAWPEAGWIFGFVSPDLSADKLRTLAGLSASTLSKPVWDQYLANWTAASFVEALEGLATPTTFILGERDPIATREHLAETMAALSSTDTVIVVNG